MNSPLKGSGGAVCRAEASDRACLFLNDRPGDVGTAEEGRVNGGRKVVGLLDLGVCKLKWGDGGRRNRGCGVVSFPEEKGVGIDAKAAEVVDGEREDSSGIGSQFGDKVQAVDVLGITAVELLPNSVPVRL